MNIIEKYRFLKSKISEARFWGFDNIDIGLVLAEDLAAYIMIGVEPLVFLKLIGSLILNRFRYTFHSKTVTSAVLFYRDYGTVSRKDMTNMMNEVENKLDSSCLREESDNKSINPFFVIDCIYAVSWYLSLRKCGTDNRTALFLVKRLAICHSLYRWIRKHTEVTDRAKLLIVRYDACDTDNLLVQIFKNKNIKTATLEHGHFHHTEYISESIYTIGAPFESFVSDYFFAWGKYCEDEAAANGINRSRILKLGALSLKDKYIEHEKKHRFAVVLAGKYAIEENNILLKYAQQLYKDTGLQYVIRPHPSLEALVKSEKHVLGMTRISNQDESIFELAEDVDFLISGSTSVVTELLFYKAIAFTFKRENTIDIYDRFDELRFFNYEQLKKLVLGLIKNENYFKDKAQEYASYLFENRDALSAHLNTINKLLYG